MQPTMFTTVYVRYENGLTYFEYDLLGETSRSWLVLPADDAPQWKINDLARYATKLPKSQKGYEFGTLQSKQLADWAVKHRYNIGSFVGGLRDAGMLEQIARIVGYKNLPEVTQ